MAQKKETEDGQMSVLYQIGTEGATMAHMAEQKTSWTKHGLMNTRLILPSQ